MQRNYRSTIVGLIDEFTNTHTHIHIHTGRYREKLNNLSDFFDMFLEILQPSIP